MPEAHTVRPRPTGRVTASWRERFGDQRIEISVHPDRAAGEADFRVTLERRWGPMIGDVRTNNLGGPMSRAGATELRDALTAALEWQPPAPAK